MIQAPPTLGLRANLGQFSLLVAINALVGGMVGLQRTIVPLLGEREFGVASAALATSFIISFGLTKALANLVSGPLADRRGRKFTLILGWLLGLPVPFILIGATRLEHIVAANILLGLNQGLAWSMTVNMKIDLVGPARRGLALGLNECAGYLAVGLTAWLTGLIAARSGLRPEPFYLGIAYATLGLALSVSLVRDTSRHVEQEARAHATPAAPPLSFGRVFAIVSWRDRNLFAVSQAGFVNNLNDGVVWGVLPLLLAARGLRLTDIGLITGAYPLIWGLAQLYTGHLSDRIGRKPLIVSGMITQAAGLALIAARTDRAFISALCGSVLLGVGTAMVYPVLLAAVGDAAHPSWRARALSVYRFWRDLGFAAGALMAGLIADRLGLAASIHAAAALTLASGLLAWAALRENPSSAA